MAAKRGPAGSGSRFADVMRDAMGKSVIVFGVLALIVVGVYARGLRLVSASPPTRPAPARAASTSTTGAPGASALSVTEREWGVSPSTKSVPAGAVTFAATNAGSTTHELVVLRTDALPTTLEVKAGRASEEGDLGEVEDLAPGSTNSVTLQLPPGHYLLICNLPGHFQKGMVSEFSVFSGGVSSSVSAQEKEWSISSDAASIPAGTVTFSATNRGTTTHELVVLSTDATPDTLPVKAGRASEEGDLGEVEDLAPGETKSVTLQLVPGHYLLICNLPGHFQQGMATELTVRERAGP
jgi:uncharacterized cupredoxin-like copper-binding protein